MVRSKVLVKVVAIFTAIFIIIFLYLQMEKLEKELVFGDKGFVDHYQYPNILRETKKGIIYDVS